MVFVNLLASVLLFVLAEPMIRLLYEGGSFDSHDTHRTAQGLMWLAPGLVAYSAVNILARGFYALDDIRTPMRISVFCLGLNIVLVILLIGQFKEAGMGLANSLSAMANAGLLVYALKRKISFLDWAEFRRSWPAMIGGALAAGFLAWALREVCSRHIGHATLQARFGEVFVPMIGAAIGYTAVGAFSKVPYAVDLLSFGFGKSRSPKR